jgi:CheY-like chemotaxis protein
LQGGLGIGLSLVRSLVALHGGSITACSAGIDQGSRFEIRLPALARHAAAGARPLRVMIVDDNADAADTMAMLLQINGHVVRVEHSGVVALEAAAQCLPDAVVCNLGKSGMGGCELATQFRKDRRFATMRLIAVTGWGAEEDRRRTRDAGFDHHLTKPASVENIEAILSRR